MLDYTIALVLRQRNHVLGLQTTLRVNRTASRFSIGENRHDPNAAAWEPGQSGIMEVRLTDVLIRHI